MTSLSHLDKTVGALHMIGNNCGVNVIGLEQLPFEDGATLCVRMPLLCRVVEEQL